jgi:hypothetical protein
MLIFYSEISLEWNSIESDNTQIGEKHGSAEESRV